MLDYHHRNPLLILVFTFTGMLIRYLFFVFVLTLVGRKTKKLLDYSKGINQVIYNVLLTFFVFTALIFFMIYRNLNK
jgi:hypothetical protein